MSQFWVLCGAVSGFISVALGAFGAHALSDKLDARALAIYQTASHYQIAHALALVLFGIYGMRVPVNQASGWFFLMGAVIFSGSLYTLAITGTRWWGAITPIGGVLLLCGWATFAWAAFREYQN